MATPGTGSYQDALDSQYLTSSISSLSRSRSTNSIIVRTYKQATQLYLTKRFKEALEALEPIVSPQGLGDGGAAGKAEGGRDGGAAPVAQSSKRTRTKVWVFYLSLLHAIIDLGAEEGKRQFGAIKWRQLAAKARDGTVWEEIVQCGYGGNEGGLDPDVVVNLATLLLGHMQDQRWNQQRLEAYISASLDAAVAAAHPAFHPDGIATPMSNGTSSPRELTTRLKILELYTLHVLPVNDEWSYAQQFIEMNEMLDEERREAFLHALAALKEEKDGTAQRSRELEELRERELEEQRAAEEAQRKEEERREEELKKAAADREKARANVDLPPRSINAYPNVANGASHAPKSSSSTAKPPGKPQKKTRAPASNMYARASSVFHHLRQLALQTGQSITGGSSSTVLLRFIMFMIPFLLMLTRRDLRQKLRRSMDESWTKVKQTVGMGVKVSYI